MEKISSYISKKVISLQEGELVGYVLNVVFDEDVKKLQALLVVDDESENISILDLKNIKGNSADCITIDSASSLQIYLEEQTNNPVGKVVYDANGLNLGQVKDVFLQGSLVRVLQTDKCEFFQRNIAKSGRNFIIYGKKSKKQKSVKLAFQIDSSRLQEVSIQSAVSNKIDSRYSSKPYRILANQNTILGRTMQADLFGFNNEIIARKFDTINQNIINKAKRHNKLNYLIYYSK